MNKTKYIDAVMKLLDPRFREIEPATGDQGSLGMMVRSFDEKNRTVEAVVSTAEVDRYEEIVEPKAYKKWLKNFMANPVLMPGHQYTRADGKPAQIGTWLDLRIETDGLVGTAWFDEDETADAWWKKYSNPDPKKRARGFSVGFLSHAWEMREFKGESSTKRLRVFTEVELLEISAVPVPANRGALARSAMFGETLELSAQTTEGDHKQLRELIASAVHEAVKKELDADLNSRLADLIGTVVAASQGNEVHRHSHDDDDDEHGELVRTLRRIAGE